MKPWQAAIRRIESDLRDLGSALDVDVSHLEEADWHFVVLQLGHRSRVLFRDFTRSAGKAPRLAVLALRPMLEAATLIRYFEVDSERHLLAWRAERDRVSGLVIDELEAVAERTGLHLPDLGDTRERLRESTERARGTLGGGQFMPSIPVRISMIKDDEIRQGMVTAYGTAYRGLSFDLHLSPLSLTGPLRRGPDGTIFIDDDATSRRGIWGHRALACSLYAYTLEAVSAIVGLRIEDRARKLRDEVMALPVVDDQSAYRRESPPDPRQS